MPIPVICPCSAKLKVSDQLLGKHVKCPKCGALLPVGGAGAAAAPPAPPPPRGTAAVLSESGLADDERKWLERELGHGERVVWAGKAAERIAFQRGWLVAGALFFTGAIFLTILLIILLQGFLSGLVGVIFLAVIGTCTVACVAGGLAWPFLARRRARRTFYAITTRRALGWFGSLFGRVKLQAFEPAAVAGVHRLALTAGPDGVGHLIFGSRVVRRKVGDGTMQYVERWGFFNVPRAAAVERLLRETLIDPFLEQVYDQ